MITTKTKDNKAPMQLRLKLNKQIGKVTIFRWVYDAPVGSRQGGRWEVAEIVPIESIYLLNELQEDINEYMSEDNE